MKRIAAVVVTYNRLELLKRSVEAILHQTVPPARVYIIDNCSTDYAPHQLETLYAAEPTVTVTRLSSNLGGAGGFSEGMRLAVRDGYDGVWVMDDDTIPHADALECLLKAYGRVDASAGFMSSRVVWRDGSLHLMNRPYLVGGDRDKPLPDDIRDGSRLGLMKNATFVSVLFTADAIRQVGLPYAEFFIWHDDIEFTDRVVKAGMAGYFVYDSVVLHDTPYNYNATLDTAPTSEAWKFYYQVRNRTFLNRLRRGNPISFWISHLNYLRLLMHRIGKRQTDDKGIFRRRCLRGWWDGIRFRPTIRYVD